MYPTAYRNISIDTYLNTNDNHKLSITKDGLWHEGTIDRCIVTKFVNYVTRSPEQKARYHEVRKNVFQLLKNAYAHNQFGQEAIRTIKRQTNNALPYGCPLTGRDVKWIIKKTEHLVEIKALVSSFDTFQISEKYHAFLEKELERNDITAKCFSQSDIELLEESFNAIIVHPNNQSETKIRSQLSLACKVIPHIMQIQNNFATDSAWAYTVYTPKSSQMRYSPLLDNQKAIPKTLSSMLDYELFRPKAKETTQIIQDLFQSPDWIQLIFTHALHPIFLTHLSITPAEEFQSKIRNQIRNLAILLISTIGSNIKEEDLYARKNGPYLQAALTMMSSENHSYAWRIKRGLRCLNLIHMPVPERYLAGQLNETDLSYE